MPKLYLIIPLDELGGAGGGGVPGVPTHPIYNPPPYPDQGLPGGGGSPPGIWPSPPPGIWPSPPGGGGPVDPGWGVRPPVDPGYGRPGWSPVDPGYGRPVWGGRPDQGLPGAGGHPWLPGAIGGGGHPSNPIYHPDKPVPPGEPPTAMPPAMPTNPIVIPPGAPPASPTHPIVIPPEGVEIWPPLTKPNPPMGDWMLAYWPGVGWVWVPAPDVGASPKK